MKIVLAPLIPLSLLAVMAAVALAICALSVLQKRRGALLRALALAAILCAIANPIFSDEDRENVQNIVSLLVDRSQSQLTNERPSQTDQALEKLKAQLSRFPNLDVRITEIENDITENPSTNLFSALSEDIADIPANRLAGTIMITDGQVHDAPDNFEELGINAPFHALITGRADEKDLRIEVIIAPRFGLVGETQEIQYKVHIDGQASDLASNEVDVELRLNGEFVSTEIVQLGTQSTAYIDIPRRGENLIELSVTPMDDEVSLSNNKAVVDIEGVRENLRVLLVSGAPHSGERAWRNLLKSDTSIDLVHFTILRPPERNDGTPINELSLIAFPTRELFIEKIDDFDLIIFDRYQRMGVLPTLYFDNIARYVEDGGALLIAAGPEFAGIRSIATTPLATIIPASPTGNISQIGFYPRISDIGKRHPVARNLDGGDQNPPEWGRWFRSINVDDLTGHNVLNGPDGSPLLILDRVDQGRVAVLLSDHGWLWSRGFEGGGPHVSLYRRIAHWLMQEPALEEEALLARSDGDALIITRQTMDTIAAPVTVTSPSLDTQIVGLERNDEGLFEKRLTIEENGLYQLSDGEFTALAHVGNVDAPEFQETISTLDKLKPLSDMTSGLTVRLDDGEGDISIPQILPVRQIPNRSGERMMLRASTETILVGVRQIPLFGGFLGLALLLLALSATWYREGR